MLPKLDPNTTALVLIDLQQGILGFGKAPRPGSAVVATAATLARRFRAVNAPVVLVRVGWSADFGDALKQPIDQPTPLPPAACRRTGGTTRRTRAGSARHPDHEAPVERLPRHRARPATAAPWHPDHRARRDLDQYRRRVDGPRRVRTRLLLVLVEDAMSCAATEQHRASLDFIFPRLGRVRQSGEVLEALAE